MHHDWKVLWPYLPFAERAEIRTACKARNFKQVDELFEPARGAYLLTTMKYRK